MMWPGRRAVCSVVLVRRPVDLTPSGVNDSMDTACLACPDRL